MSEALPSTAVGAPAPAVTAGSMLRQARQARGLHIAALATSIKVTPQKLELLESDRFDELPDATFARALAQTVCRFLKIDSAPVMALLPQPVDRGLEHLSLGLNTPFRDRPGRRVPSELQFLKSPITLGALVLVLASLAVYLLPSGWINKLLPQRVASQIESAEPGAAPGQPQSIEPVPERVAESGVSRVTSPDVLPGAAPTASTVVETVPTVVSSLPNGSAPAAAPVAANAAAQAVAPAATSSDTQVVPASSGQSTHGVLMLRAKEASWVEVVDARGAALLSRMLQAGETVGLDGASPLRVKIGNASATAVIYRGKTVNLQPARDNVAKLELK